MARASTETLLSLDRFAQVMQINPSHFNSATCGDVMVLPGQCNHCWYQYGWQSHDRISREDLAREIRQAEEDLASRVGFWAAPRFIDDEMHVYSRHYRRNVRGNGLNVYGLGNSLTTKWGKFISPGQRGLTYIGSPTVAGGGIAFTDADLDGYPETVTVTIATTLTDASELKVYFTGHVGEPEWEIRPARTKIIAAGTLTATFWKWQFIDPDRWEAFPTIAGSQELQVDTTDAGNIVDQVDVYREFCDPTEESAQFFWEPELVNINVTACPYCGGAECPVCSITAQDGCIHVRDVDRGIVVPALGTYDSASASWIHSTPAVCRAPDMVKIWYYAGDLDDQFLANRSTNPLSDFWAQTIAWLATARLQRPPCTCGGATNAIFEMLQEDLAVNLSGRSYQNSFANLDCPFGTRRGELEAWRRIKNFKQGRHVTGGSF